MGERLVNGISKNEKTGVNLSIPMGASEIIPAGGAFVVDDGDGKVAIAGDGSTLLAGYVFPVELDSGKLYQTCSSTERGTVVPFIPIGSMLGMVIRRPVTGGTYASTMILETCDLEVVSNMQGCQVDASAEDTVIIVGGDADLAYVDVMVNPAKITGQTGVA